MSINSLLLYFHGYSDFIDSLMPKSLQLICSNIKNFYIESDYNLGTPPKIKFLETLAHQYNTGVPFVPYLIDCKYYQVPHERAHNYASVYYRPALNKVPPTKETQLPLEDVFKAHYYPSLVDEGISIYHDSKFIRLERDISLYTKTFQQTYIDYIHKQYEVSTVKVDGSILVKHNFLVKEIISIMPNCQRLKVKNLFSSTHEYVQYQLTQKKKR